MSRTNSTIFTGLRIVAWVIFVGLCIEAGGLIVNFIFSVCKPEMVPRLYQKLDLSDMHQRSRWAFFSMYALVLAIAILKAALFYIVIVLLTKIDLLRPFNTFVSRQILMISYCTLAIGLLSYIARESAAALASRGFATGSLSAFWEDSQAFILMAAIIYMIATIFKTGMAIQAENELTI